MPRTHKVYLRDILDAIRKIENYTCDLSFDEFLADELKQDGVARNLEIVGEAVKRLPEDVRGKRSDVEWRKIAGLRDILIHQYSSVDWSVIWDIVENKVPTLKEEIAGLLAELEESEQ